MAQAFVTQVTQLVQQYNTLMRDAEDLNRVRDYELYKKFVQVS